MLWEVLPAAHASFCRVVAKQHHKFTVFDIRGAVTVIAAVGVRHGAGNLRGTVSPVLTQKTAVAVHQASNRGGHRGRAGDVSADNPGSIVNVHSLVTVPINGIFQALRNSIERLIPGIRSNLPSPRLPTRFIG